VKGYIRHDVECLRWQFKCHEITFENTRFPSKVDFQLGRKLMIELYRRNTVSPGYKLPRYIAASCRKLKHRSADVSFQCVNHCRNRSLIDQEVLAQLAAPFVLIDGQYFAV